MPSSTLCMARAFITVANMPMESAWARSMPLAAPATPRKMFPPPMTRQISAPSARAAAIAWAKVIQVGMSIPNWPGPIRASPESFRSTRRYFSWLFSGSFAGMLFTDHFQTRTKKIPAVRNRQPGLFKAPHGQKRKPDQEPFVIEATSAAKSVSSFSTPSPSLKCTNAFSVAPCALRNSPTVLSGSMMKGCSRSTTSL